MARTVSRTNMSPQTLATYATILACSLALLGVPGIANATTLEPISTTVVGPPKHIEYPQPICSKCRVVAQVETNDDDQTRGLLLIGYEDEVYVDFEGSIEVTVLLSNDTRYVEIIQDVTLDENEEMTWVLPDPAQLSWLEVEHVWVEMVPAG
jgi:hypothetical protein